MFQLEQHRQLSDRLRSAVRDSNPRSGKILCSSPLHPHRLDIAHTNYPVHASGSFLCRERRQERETDQTCISCQGTWNSGAGASAINLEWFKRHSFTFLCRGLSNRTRDFHRRKMNSARFERHSSARACARGNGMGLGVQCFTLFFTSSVPGFINPT